MQEDNKAADTKLPLQAEAPATAKGEIAPIETPDGLVSMEKPKALAEFATQLKDFIKHRELFTVIQGKGYVNVEGWQFAGASLGVVPVVVGLERIPNPEDLKEIRYRAEVQLVRVSNGVAIGAGIAICSSKENSRGNADEYVIASMAQTRAIGKAYRNSFAWLMKIAGYEPTPTEEVIDSKETPDSDSESVISPELVKKIEKAKTVKELSKINSTLEPGQKRNAGELIQQRLKQLSKNGGKGAAKN